MPRSRMTGPDYLMAVSERLGQRFEVPYTQEFKHLLWGAFPDEGEVPGTATAIASKPLTEVERSAATIVSGAAQMAARNKDWESLNEVLRVGIQLAFRLPEYVEMTNLDLDDRDGDEDVE